MKTHLWCFNLWHQHNILANFGCYFNLRLDRHVGIFNYMSWSATLCQMCHNVLLFSLFLRGSEMPHVALVSPLILRKPAGSGDWQFRSGVSNLSDMTPKSEVTYNIFNKTSLNKGRGQMQECLTWFLESPVRRSLTLVASLQTKVEGSDKNLRHVKMLCWNHKVIYSALCLPDL